MAKPNTDAICGMKCPQCGAEPGCLKDPTHFGQTEHFCSNCLNTWGP